MIGRGAPHTRARLQIRDVLGGFFGRMGRKITLASDMAVHYPGAPVFCPDLFAVLEVADPGEDDERMAWVVAQEGRGLDLVLEITHHGDRQKDLATNVETYARLGIPEVFVYDVLRHRVRGYRLPTPGAHRYQTIPTRAGLLRSEVLGLDLGVLDRRLRFYTAGAELPDTPALLTRAHHMLDELEDRAEQEAQRAEQAERRAEQEAQRATVAEQRAEAALAEVAALRAQLARLTGSGD